MSIATPINGSSNDLPYSHFRKRHVGTPIYFLGGTGLPDISPIPKAAYRVVDHEGNAWISGIPYWGLRSFEISLPLLTADFLRAWEHFGRRRLIVSGHSQAAILIIALLRAHPDKFAAVAPVSGPLGGTTLIPGWFAKFCEKLPGHWLGSITDMAVGSKALTELMTWAETSWPVQVPLYCLGAKSDGLVQPALSCFGVKVPEGVIVKQVMIGGTTPSEIVDGILHLPWRAPMNHFTEIIPGISPLPGFFRRIRRDLRGVTKRTRTTRMAPNPLTLVSDPAS